MLAQFPAPQTPISNQSQPLEPIVSETLATAGSIQSPVPEPPTSNRPKIIWISSIVVALIVLIAVGVWVYLGYQKFAQIQNQVFENQTTQLLTEPSPNSSGLDESVIATDPEQVQPSAKSDIVLPEDWVTQEYTSNGQVVWHLAHPSATTVNQSGLHEGYLELQTNWNGARLETQLAFPLFAQGIPETFDQWVTDYVTTSTDLAGDVIVEKGMADGVLIRIVKDGSLKAINQQTSTPATLIFVWSYTTDTGESRNPAMITIRQLDSSDRQVESFAEMFVAGLKFQR